jgi:hypothetical protein
VASSFRSVSAVWENFEALVRHFQEAENDPTRDKKKIDACTRACREKLHQLNLFWIWG